MKTRMRLMWVMLTLSLAVPAALASTTWYVNGGTGKDTNNCRSATTACKTIGHAISLAASGDSVMVAAATYYENLTIGVSLNVIGSGAPTTIIDGRCFNTVITIPNTSASVALSQVTVRNGCARYGGGISNRGTLRIIASTISGNRASIYNKNGSTGAGGIENIGTLTINNSTLTGNTAKAFCYEGCDAYGGGIANAISATLAINNSTLSGNVASGGCDIFRYCSAYGGGVAANGTVIINSSTLSGNSANNFPIGCGGISGPARLQNTILRTALRGETARAL